MFRTELRQAGAVTVLGRRYGLPEAHSDTTTSGCGVRTPDGSVFIVIGGDEADNLNVLEAVTPSTRCEPLAMPYERGTVVWIGRKLKLPFKELWPNLKHYD